MKKILCIFLVVVLAISCVLFASCQNFEIADNTEHYDAITKKLKLAKNYQGKSFMVDGIGVATVAAYTDGDTTRFTTGDDTIVIRYYCINTPESTGGVEKWGKAASVFVKNQLSKATEIVLESSTGGRPERDNNGTRYLGYVWYKTAEYNEFKLLNLELIENGYTDNKALNTDKYAYYSYMNEANNFAKKIQLRLYSKLDDPMFSTNPISMTIKDFWEHTDVYYKEDLDVGEKVIFEAYFENISISSGGTHTFTAVQYDEATGKTYKLAVYTGYVSSPASSMKIGNKYVIIGTIQNFNGNFQVSGITYNSLYQDKTPGGSYILQRNYYLTFDSSEEYCEQFNTSLYTNATVESSEVKDGVLTIIATAYIRTSTDFGKQSEFTFRVNVSDDYQNNFVKGKKFSTRGYQFVANSGVINVPSISDIIMK